MYDIIIIGSGPAGLSAAVYASRAMLNVLVLEKEAVSGGQIAYTEQVDNYLGLNGISGFEMAMKFRAHAEVFGGPFQEGCVQKVVPNEEGFQVHLEDGVVLETKTVIAATGAGHRHLGIPGEAEFSGRGVSYCATCDGAFFRQKEVAVIGGGDVALADALYLSKMCKKVYLIHRREELRAAKRLQEQMKKKENIIFLPYYEAVEIQGAMGVEGILIRNNQTGEEKQLPVAGAFVAIGMEPAAGYLRGLADMDAAGYLLAGEDCATNIPGLFAAGDIRSKTVRQVVTAVADGAAAVKSVEDYLD